jgi:hypothetical protein
MSVNIGDGDQTWYYRATLTLSVAIATTASRRVLTGARMKRIAPRLNEIELLNKVLSSSFVVHHYRLCAV